MVEQGAWRGMPYYDVFWRKRHLTRRELRAVYANYYTVVFWALIISVLVLLDLHGFAERVSVAAQVVYTTSLAVITFMLYFLFCEIGIKLSQRYVWFFLIFPLVGFVSMTFATYLMEFGMSGYFGGRISLENAASKLPVNLILTLVAETFFLTFVLPMTSRSKKYIAIDAEAKAKPLCETFIVAGETYFCDQLVSVSSQDHYVRIQTKDSENLVRARLSDLINQLSCQSGIQPHRSYWVARQAVAGMVARDGHKCLELHNGNTIPIARGRLVDVQEWLENGRR